MRRFRVVVAVVVAAVLLAGCGGAARRQPEVRTIGVYGIYPRTRVPGSAKPSAAVCRQDARIFADDAVLFVAHTGPEAAYPADLYYMNLRGVFTDFLAHRCAPSLLREPLARRLTAKQRAVLVANLPREMAAAVRTAG